ncbi:MAG: hypothetical protein ACI8ZB_000012 [Desulforhopalus sp.]|jgi:hypothetical protein
MYLAKQQHSLSVNYQLRESFVTDVGTYGNRVLFDLGPEPTQFFTIVEDHVVIFNEVLLNTLSQNIKKDPDSVLEKLLFEFFPASVQQKLLTFKDRSAQYRGPLTKKELKAIHREIHIFDRRRLYYLRYGAVDQSRLTKLHEKCCQPLLGQSRDEREYYFMAEEMVLEPGSYFQYIFAIFNLQKFFDQSFAPWLPEALARVEVENQFTEVICTLQKDISFWQTEKTDPSLHHHLARYLWMFFDFVPHQPSVQRDFARAFMGNHRTFKWPEKKVEASPETVEELFGISLVQLNSLKKDELTRFYRKKAMDLHPDKGGDAEQFISLTEIYTTLLSKK